MKPTAGSLMEGVVIGRVEQFPLKLGKTVRCLGKEIAVFRVAEERLLAVENRCPHKNGVLSEGLVSGEVVFCPMHDRRIDLHSGLVQFPDTGCVRTFEVVVRDGWVSLIGLPASSAKDKDPEEEGR